MPLASFFRLLVRFGAKAPSAHVHRIVMPGSMCDWIAALVTSAIIPALITLVAWERAWDPVRTGELFITFKSHGVPILPCTSAFVEAGPA